MRGSSHHDLWESQKLVQKHLSQVNGCPDLGLPALGGLFDQNNTSDLNESFLSNLHFLKALRALCLVQQKHGKSRVDFRNMESEELGSVYESLLEMNLKSTAI